MKVPSKVKAQGAAFKLLGKYAQAGNTVVEVDAIGFRRDYSLR